MQLLHVTMPMILEEDKFRPCAVKEQDVSMSRLTDKKQKAIAMWFALRPFCSDWYTALVS